MSKKVITFNTLSELEQWLKENRGKKDFVVKDQSGKIIDSGEIDIGFLGNLAREFIRPIRNIVATTIAPGLKDDMSLAEQERFQKDPTGFRIQQTIGTIASFLPLGIGKAGSLIKAASTGAAAATAGSLANQDLQNLKTDELLKSAAVGAIGGAVLNKLPIKSEFDSVKNLTIKQTDDLSDLISKSIDDLDKILIKTEPQNIISKGAKDLLLETRLKARATPMSPSFIKDLDFRKEAVDDLYTIGKNVTGKFIPYTEKNTELLYDALSKGYSKSLKNLPVKVEASKISKIITDISNIFNVDNFNKQTFKNKLLAEIQSALAASGKDELVKKLRRISTNSNLDNLSFDASEIFDLYQTLTPKRIKFENAEKFGTQLTQAQKSLMVFEQKLRDLFDDKISSEINLPQIKKIAKILRGVAESAPDRAAYFNKTDRVSQEGALRIADTISKKAIDSLANLTLKASFRPNKNVQNLIQNKINSIVKNNILSTDLKNKLNTALNRLIGSTIKEPYNFNTLTDLDDAVELDFDTIEQSFSLPKNQIDSLKLEAFKAAYEKTGKINDAIAFANFLTKQAAVSAEQTKQNARAVLGLQGLDRIEKLLKDDNLNLLALQTNLPNFLRTREGQLFATAQSQIAQSVLRILSGANIPKHEQDMILKLLPEFGDDKKTLEFKLNSLRRFFTTTAPNLIGQNVTIVDSVTADTIND
ncbi:MAG: hypothetical protein NZZ41_04195 [Candidatus Dojkabacteria bacterium]|nr:hypothetical protein [Candidatus Dojkabacteria bacterium]